MAQNEVNDNPTRPVTPPTGGKGGRKDREPVPERDEANEREALTARLAELEEIDTEQPVLDFDGETYLLRDYSKDVLENARAQLLFADGELAATKEILKSMMADAGEWHRMRKHAGRFIADLTAKRGQAKTDEEREAIMSPEQALEHIVNTILDDFQKATQNPKE